MLVKIDCRKELLEVLSAIRYLTRYGDDWELCDLEEPIRTYAIGLGNLDEGLVDPSYASPIITLRYLSLDEVEILEEIFLEMNQSIREKLIGVLGAIRVFGSKFRLLSFERGILVLEVLWS